MADIIWLNRFLAAPGPVPVLDSLSKYPIPGTLNATLYPNLAVLKEQRQNLDELFLMFAQSLAEQILQKIVVYKSVQGTEYHRGFFSLLRHIFNHQTHHRGQTTTLLSQAGLDIGVTDLLARIPDHGHAN